MNSTFYKCATWHKINNYSDGDLLNHMICLEFRDVVYPPWTPMTRKMLVEKAYELEKREEAAIDVQCVIQGIEPLPELPPIEDVTKQFAAIVMNSTNSQVKSSKQCVFE